LNLPNALTCVRIALIPLFAYVYYLPEPRWALMIFLLAGTTDLLDGYLARKWQQVTSFGKLMDPLADKLLTLTALYVLADTGHIHWWMVWAMLGKELVMVLGAALMLRHTVVAADLSGKLATTAFTLAVFAVFPWHSYAWLTRAGGALMYLAVALSLYAMVHYGLSAIRGGKK